MNGIATVRKAVTDVFADWNNEHVVKRRGLPLCATINIGRDRGISLEILDRTDLSFAENVRLKHDVVVNGAGGHG